MRSAQCVPLAYALLIAHCALVPSTVRAQGFLPPKSSSTTVIAESQGPLLIGDKVPERLNVQDENGKKRHLLTYKSPLEVMVVGFYTATCPDKVSRWDEMARFYTDYKDWRVSFVAINAGDAAARADLAKKMAKAGLDIPLLEEEDHALTQFFRIGSIPMLVIIDEFGDFRYRGPLGRDARQAIEAVISHIDPVAHPQPLAQEECSVE
jgi:hypothetical protein